LHCRNVSFPLVQQTLHRTLAGPFVRCWQSVNKFGALRSCNSCYFGGLRSGFTRATGGFSSNRYVTCVFCSVLFPFYSMCITKRSDSLNDCYCFVFSFFAFSGFCCGGPELEMQSTVAENRVMRIFRIFSSKQFYHSQTVFKI
jgi:hypothetical protein